MNQQTKRIILDHLNEYLEDKELNTVDLKTSEHLPVSGRWVDSLRQSVRDEDNRGFNTKKTIELLEVLELPYFMDGSQLVIKSHLVATFDLGKATESERKHLKDALGGFTNSKSIVFIPADVEAPTEFEGCEICDESEDVNECHD